MTSNFVWKLDASRCGEDTFVREEFHIRWSLFSTDLHELKLTLCLLVYVCNISILFVYIQVYPFLFS